MTKQQELNVVDQYASKNSSSKVLFDRAKNVLPGGSTRTVLFYRPYPFYARYAQGSHIWDMDANERIDFCFNYSVLILGHNNAAVNNAIQEQLANGTTLGAPTEPEVKLAEKILQRLNNADKVRFVSTGTEAVMNAVRLARGYSGKELIVKFEGAFHGTYDDVWISVSPSEEKAGSPDRPNSVPECIGIPSSVISKCLVLPFNNLQNFEESMKERGKEVAAVIVEPVLGVAGAIPPKRDFLRGVIEICKRIGIIVIFDEIVTGFRLSAGGAQQLFDVEPDITTFGKVVGGGMPIGGVASTNEIMKPYDIPPNRKPDIPLSGTFNGHPLAMAAGLAVLDQLDHAAYERLNTLGNLVRDGLTKIFNDHHVPAQITGIGSLFDIHFCEIPISDYRATLRADKSKKHLFEIGLLNKGIYFTHLHWNNISLSTTTEDVTVTLDKTRQLLEEDMLLASP